jgi:hypothetical protein
MMEGPLLEDKFWTEPSIVDTDEIEGEGDVDKRLKRVVRVQIHTFLVL